MKIQLKCLSCGHETPEFDTSDLWPPDVLQNLMGNYYHRPCIKTRLGTDGKSLCLNSERWQGFMVPSKDYESEKAALAAMFSNSVVI